MPVKEARFAKSRLHPPAPLSRPDLARAIALDTLEAVCRGLTPADVVVVTSDDGIAAAARTQGCAVLADPAEGLNEAIREGLKAAVDPGTAVGILLGDLPALRPADLRAGLAACAPHERAVIPDRAGGGTVLLTGAPGTRLEPQFGEGSAARHAQTAALLTPDLPHLRQDVDDLADLAAAAQLGVGRHTALVLAEAATLPGPSEGN